MTVAEAAGPQPRLPLRRLSRVCHIGTLDPEDKGPFSWESHGLSVSLDPERWEEIAKLGGRRWHLLERDQGAFLDYWSMSPKLRRHIASWGISRGLVRRQLVFALHRPDTELADTMITLHATHADALAEADEDPDAEIKRTVSYPGTAALTARTGMPPPELDAFDAMLVCHVEDAHPHLDGVWWQDRPGPLSAPRGCIVPARLPEWTVSTLARSHAARLLVNP